MTTRRECANPTCTTTLPPDAPTWRIYCGRRCQVATLNNRGNITLRLTFTADEYHALEDYVEAEGYPGATLADVAKEIVWDEVIADTGRHDPLADVRDRLATEAIDRRPGGFRP